MTIAYCCILIAALLPYVWTGIAKRSGQPYDNRDPRGWLARQDNPRSVRANAAQFNAFEAFAPFAAAVLMAQFAGLDMTLVSLLAIVFVACRVAHGVCYIANLHLWRSVVWFGGLSCVLWLMTHSAVRIAAGT